MRDTHAKCVRVEVSDIIIIDITVRDMKLIFPLNQNVLRDVTSRWSMRVTARSSDY